MTREIIAPTDKTKIRIYQILSRGSKRLVDIIREAGYGTNKVTPLQCLNYGIDHGEVGKDKKTKEYSLTPKGKEVLDRLENALAIKEQKMIYRGPLEVDSSNELHPVLRPILGHRNFIYSLNSNTLPLPHKVVVGFGGSEEILDLLEEAEYLVRKNENLGSKKVAAAALKVATDSFIKEVLWAAILKRISILSELHRPSSDEGNKTKRHTRKPAPLNLSNILGFDLIFNLRYEGKKVDELGVGLKHLVERRLAGGILLFLARGGLNFRNIARVRRLIPLLRDGGLLGQDDAKMILNVAPNPYMFDITQTDRMKEALLTVAYRYLRESGVLQLGNITPESLARHITSNSL